MAKSELIKGDLPTKLAGPKGVVKYAVILPPNFSASASPYPLILDLHGGGGSRDDLGALHKTGFFDREFEAGRATPHVRATITNNFHFYSDYADGSYMWETFLLEEFIPFLEKNHNCGGKRELRYLTGASMGGHGSLKLAFRRPDMFAALAALEPGVDPALDPQDLTDRAMPIATGPANPWKKIIGPPMKSWSGAQTNVDRAQYRKQNPPSIAVDNAENIKKHGLKIYFEAGDRDMLNLHDGAEFLHRVLWDQRIEHEYHLVHLADHVGASMAPRQRETDAWLYRMMGLIISGKAEEPWSGKGPAGLDDEERAFFKWMDGGMKGPRQGKIVDNMSDKMITRIRETQSKMTKKMMGPSSDGPAEIAGFKWRSSKL